MGNDCFLYWEKIDYDICDVVGIVVYFVVDGCYGGYILIVDEIKEDVV